MVRDYPYHSINQLNSIMNVNIEFQLDSQLKSRQQTRFLKIITTFMIAFVTAVTTYETPQLNPLSSALKTVYHSTVLTTIVSLLIISSSCLIRFLLTLIATIIFPSSFQNDCSRCGEDGERQRGQMALI